MPCLEEPLTDPLCYHAPPSDQIAAVVRDRGVAVMALAGDERTPYCAYTIGRTEHGQPELLILTRTLKELMPLTGLLCYLGLREMQDGRVIGPTDDDVFLVTDPSHWPDAPDYIHERLVVQADAYYGRRVDVLLLVRIENPEALFGEEESPERPPAAVIH